MKFLYIVAFLVVSLIPTGAFAEDAVSPEEQKILKDCNLAARNSLISGDVKAVKDFCTRAMNEMEKSYPDKEYMINPMLNLAFTYSLVGNFDGAEQLYTRARELGEKFFKPESREMKSIEDFIKDQQNRKDNPPQFNKSGVTSPHQ